MTYYFVIDLQDASKKLFLHDDRRIQIQSRIRSRIHTSVKWIRIREAQKHVDPDSDPDLEHCSSVNRIFTAVRLDTVTIRWLWKVILHYIILG